ncbi:MAG: glycosyltransferase [Acidimicrobiia bacterium]
MTGIHQVLAGASPGDAITSAALELRDLLRQVGPSEVYARHVVPALAHEVRSLSKYPTRSSRDVLIYHASIGEPQVHAFLLSRREPIVVVYHNVTPAGYFVPWDTAFAELLELGRSELVDLQHRVIAAVADSTFNAVELEAMGYSDVLVIPPVLDPHRLVGIEPHAPTLSHLDNAMEGPFLLFVGQLLPHKRPDFLVKAMHVATTYLDVDAYLMLVGHTRLPSYSSAIDEKIRELNLPRVHLMGAIDESRLAAMYSRAQAFVTASEHEGFCVPLLEAMAFGVPVVARRFAAIPETLGGAGILIPGEDGPSLFAEAVADVLETPALREELVLRGKERVGAFDRSPSQSKVLRLLLDVI